jgi:hypothetical protein
MTFKAWDVNGSEKQPGESITVTKDIEVKALWQDLFFTVTYVDEAGNTIGTPQSIKYGEDAVPEVIPEKEGYTAEWDHNGKNITAHTTIRPIYTIKTFTVTYQDEEGNIIGTPQTVNYGEDAVPEVIPEKKGFTAEWSHDGKNIKEDTVITPVYRPIVVSPPATGESHGVAHWAGLILLSAGALFLISRREMAVKEKD